MISAEAVRERAAEARSDYLTKLRDVLGAEWPAGSAADESALFDVWSELADLAALQARDAVALWSATAGAMAAAAVDLPDRRRAARSKLEWAAAALNDAAEKAQRFAPERCADAVTRLKKLLARVSSRAAAARLPWGADDGLRVDAKLIEESRAAAARGEAVDLGGWIRELQGQGD